MVLDDDRTPLLEPSSPSPKYKGSPNTQKRDSKGGDAAVAVPVGMNDDDHLLSILELEQRYLTCAATGITPDEAAARLARDGPNAITPPSPQWMRKIFGYLFGGFCWLLWIAAIITFIAWKPLGDPPAVANLALAIVILVVIFLQAAFTAHQDWASSRVMSSINSMLPKFAVVVRGGHVTKLPVADIVTGDLVAVKYGQKVPADVRVVKTDGLRIDNSVLTGESEPISCAVEATHDSIHETRNVIRMGAHVTEGEGLGIVVATGDRTMVGYLARMAGRAKVRPTILQREIQHFVRTIATLAIGTGALCLIVWAAWVRRSYPGFLNLSNMLSTDMGVIVAYVPEGLPIALTLVLTIVARRMYRQKVLVKNLTTVETLGCVNVLCSDKTGTLTTNQMAVATVAVFNRAINVGRRRLSDTDAASLGFRQLSLAAGLCNGATFDHHDDPNLPFASRRVNGDATDAALLRYSASLHEDGDLERYERLLTVPFNSKTKYMAAVVRVRPTVVADDSRSVDLLSGEKIVYGAAGRPVLLVKGAPDVIMRRCTMYTASDMSGSVCALSENARAELLQVQEDWSSRGQRVLLVARRVLEREIVPGVDVDLYVDDLVIIGLVGIVDPPRPETAEVVSTIRGAGVRVFMVTGDHPLTATSIARQVGIFTRPVVHGPSDLLHAENSGGASLLLTGADVGRMTETLWDRAADYEEIVFARTTPEHKLQIVTAMQGRGNIVAVTGDGVNDAPALKNADIGVAMGSGSDVAMEAAAMVLLDSNFSSVIEALREGRTVFENLKKVCIYLLPAGSFSELIPVLCNLLLGVPAPLSSFLMIIICVLTDMAPAMALMYEKGESDLLTRPPRRPSKDALVNLRLLLHSYMFLGVIEAFFAHMMYFVYLYAEWGIEPRKLFFAFDDWGVDGYAGLTAAQQAEANASGQCVYFVTLVIMQFGNLLATRTRKLSIFHQSPLRNPRLFLAMVVSLVVAVIVLHISAIQNVFSTRTIPTQYWFIPVPLALFLLSLDELRKLVVRTRPESFVARWAW